MPTEETDPIKKFQSAVLTAAADAVLKEMTPEVMRECATKLITDALGNVNQYNNLGRVVRDEAEKYMKEQLATPTYQAQIREAVVKGINEALSSLSNEVKGRVADIALKSLATGLSQSQRSY